MLSRLDELLLCFFDESFSKPDLLDDVECDHLLMFWPLASATLFGRLFDLTRLEVTMAVNWNPTCSGLAGRAFVKGPREFDRDDSDAFLTVTVEDEVEFDLDILLLCDAPFDVEVDMLYPGFACLSMAQLQG